MWAEGSAQPSLGPNRKSCLDERFRLEGPATGCCAAKEPEHSNLLSVGSVGRQQVVSRHLQVSEVCVEGSVPQKPRWGPSGLTPASALSQASRSFHDKGEVSSEWTGCSRALPLACWGYPTVVSTVQGLRGTWLDCWASALPELTSSSAAGRNSVRWVDRVLSRCKRIPDVVSRDRDAMELNKRKAILSMARPSGRGTGTEQGAGPGSNWGPG